MNRRSLTGILLMIAGPVLVLSSPWLLFCPGPIHDQVFDEGWAFINPGCVWVSEPIASAIMAWFSVLAFVGIGALFVGLRLFRSAQSSI